MTNYSTLIVEGATASAQMLHLYLPLRIEALLEAAELVNHFWQCKAPAVGEAKLVLHHIGIEWLHQLLRNHLLRAWSRWWEQGWLLGVRRVASQNLRLFAKFTLSQIYVKLTETTATVGHVCEQLRVNWGSEYTVVTSDGLKVEDCDATQC